MAKNVRFEQRPNYDSDLDDDDDGAIEFDSMGRMVVRYDDSRRDGGATAHEEQDEEGDRDVDYENEQIKFGAKRRQLTKFESVKVAKADAKKKASRKQNEGKQLGAAYKSKKAGGDVKKKGQKYEP